MSMAELEVMVGRMLNSRFRRIPMYAGISGRAFPYGGGSVLKRFIRIPGGLVWFEVKGDWVVWMWEPRKEA